VPRQVLILLTLQLLTTLASASLFIYASAARQFVLSEGWPLYTAIFSPFVFLLALMCYQRSHPTNLLLLAGFTLAESYTVGFLCAVTYASGAGVAIWQAVGITAAVFISLASYVLLTNRDFSRHGLLLLGLLVVLIVAGLFVPFFGATAHLVYACAGALSCVGNTNLHLPNLPSWALAGTSANKNSVLRKEYRRENQYLSIELQPYTNSTPDKRYCRSSRTELNLYSISWNGRTSKATDSRGRTVAEG